MEDVTEKGGQVRTEGSSAVSSGMTELLGAAAAADADAVQDKRRRAVKGTADASFRMLNG